MAKVNEWSPEKKWNPFNSYKLLSQVYRWRKIKKGGKIPQPSLVTIDPINLCNQKCRWCNADNILSKSKSMISREDLLKIADFLGSWENDWEKGVEAVCIAGGGEPLMNPHVGELIERLRENNIEVGIVTNGVLIDKFIEPLSKCTWVGVSVDAGSKETLTKLKGKDHFDKIIENIRKLYDYSKEHDTLLSTPIQGYGIGFKYLLHPENIHEISKAAKIAKDAGCKNFHMRPVGVAWDKIDKQGSESLVFNDGCIKQFHEETAKARELEDNDFGVFGITHKFNDKFNKANQFSNCYAIFMSGVFMPSEDNKGFNFGVCCDRRGDDVLLLGKNLKHPDEILKLWGSDKHWDIFKQINVNKCPRCTYQPHNQIYEHVIQNDSMTYKFI